MRLRCCSCRKKIEVLDEWSYLWALRSDAVKCLSLEEDDGSKDDDRIEENAVVVWCTKYIQYNGRSRAVAGDADADADAPTAVTAASCLLRYCSR